MYLARICILYHDDLENRTLENCRLNATAKYRGSTNATFKDFLLVTSSARLRTRSALSRRNRTTQLSANYLF